MKKTATAILASFLALACLLTACVGKTETTTKTKTETLVYKDGMFTDVPASSPYRDYVAAVYEMGLMGGLDKQNCFGASESVNTAAAISLAARLHSLYSGDKAQFQEGDPWYQVYVDYAEKNGILDSQPDSYTAYITRAAFAELLAKCMPAEALPGINTVEDGAIPDVSMDSPYAESIYRLYRAGVFTGEKEDGSFRPDDNITRAEAAQAAARMAASSMRGKVTLSKPAEFSPDLTEQTAANDDYFKDAAILGNSLVEGLKMYSKLTTISYYSGTSMSVTSASKSALPGMLAKKYSKIYIELGINEIGENVDTFISDYGAMIDKIKAAEPDAKIYIMAILPVSQAKSTSGGSYTIERVKEYNTALYDLAKAKECYYLDDFAALVGSDGYLPADQTWDGVHLTADTYAVWENYIRTHYAAEK